MKRIYNIAGHKFGVSGTELCKAVDSMAGFSPFETNGTDTLFDFVENCDVPEIKDLRYKSKYENVTQQFGTTANGYMLTLTPEGEEALQLWHNNGENTVNIHGYYELRLVRFALWIGYGLMTLPHDTIAIHSSCIVYRNNAVLFLGESGTGKSTHTRLWRENIEGATLLNDDSPIIRIENGKVWAYGSPWSGKTHCYKAERYELRGCVRISQAPANSIKKLPLLRAYGSIHPSCPPDFAYDNHLYDHVSRIIGKILTAAQFYHLECLPDKAAALLSCKTIFHDKQ